MKCHGLDALGRRPARMLNRIGVHGKSVHSSLSGIAVLAGENFAVGRPATGRGVHVSMRRTVRIREQPSASNTRYMSRVLWHPHLTPSNV